jgi:hypothetical protein
MSFMPFMAGNMSFDITFNAPAARAFFEGADGVRITVEGGAPCFLPVSSFRDHRDALPLERRPRGGLQGHVEGKKTEVLLSALVEASRPGRPYFLLSKRGDGWLELRHLDRDGEPARHLPHMRFWPPAATGDAVDGISSAARADLSYAATILHSAKVVEAWRRKRQPGRPPQDVEEAQKVMAAFIALVKDVRPHLLLEDHLDLDLLRRTHSALGDLLAHAAPTATPTGDSDDA